ncbi:SLC13 family permease [Lentiprolixibacter aurantiacus]|uniref:SLC13 family permease n=1 Tax=Lentiprolixibacter aurantiacus TaxID=2993939 RepID=A0AAE3MMA5_9FLAO|nr:SLC13 family permease [Lentiprolixibacter aurantiacus]MCX2720028.1 SLC13 family permease [Lentiprolixibacter aurantiacus]
MPTGRKYIPDNPAKAIRYLLFVAAPFIAAYLIAYVELDPDKPVLTYTLAVAVLMAIWWVTEIVPLAITSLLPIVLFPAFGIMDGREVSATYFNHVIFLFIGGFLVALAIQKWGLHKRIALKILKIVGSSPARILLGFMFATAFLSMWISNTATAMLMVPILLSIITKLEEINTKALVNHFAVGLLLSIAYSASIGGVATLVGTPPNLSFARIFYIYFPEAPEISFATWFFYAFPITVLLFGLVFGYLYFIFVKRKTQWKSLRKEEIAEAYLKLGSKGFEEKVLLVAFAGLALLWFFRADIVLGSFTIPGWSGLFNQPEFFNDGTVAILVAVILFIIPSKSSPGTFLMDWKAAEEIPWEIILLFGGGFALASGFKESGLSLWFGQQLEWLSGMPPIVLILCISLLVTFLTEVTSNTATVETLLPILAGLAVSIETNPLLFMLPATIAGSLAFMLPVATPPNAIVFGSKRLTVIQMAKTGFVLNLIGVILVSLVTYYFGTLIFDISEGIFPDWAIIPK